jgi:hypothetical protein
LVIPEDFTKDQAVLQPIVEAMLAAVGVQARVTVCMNPRLRGVSDALKWERIERIIDSYRGMYRLFLLVVDRDGKPGRRQKLDRLERSAAKALANTDRVFLAENAWQELEVWVLAGLKDLPRKWKDVRDEADPKERFFEPHARSRGVHEQPYGGRGTLATEAAANYKRIRDLCKEDVAQLEDRIRAALGGVP